MANQSSDEKLAKTPLHERHVALGGRMVPFAGYEMPVQYPSGIIAEHNQTRESAGLFDVSHMGQCFVIGPDHETTAAALEALVPADILGLELGQQRYTQFTNENGGIIDDLMVTRSVSPDDDGRLFLVVNAACKDVDFALLKENLPEGIRFEEISGRALLAVQGPKAVDALSRHCPQAAALSFMSATSAEFDGIDCHISRSGYTGEDGYEISVQAEHAGAVMDALLAEPEIEPIGLGARDSLRLEAGLCLYGHDIDQTTTPVEAGLLWSIGKRRREEGGFPGAHIVQQQIAEGRKRARVGILPEGRAPAREGTVMVKDGTEIGTITSGGFGPSVGGPVAMGYVSIEHAKADTALDLMVRGKALPARVAKLPFSPHGYKR
ncbi:MAG: glycine cleavage system aminomethyltransferase GcvT [Hyphomicrobiales bacterium]